MPMLKMYKLHGWQSGPPVQKSKCPSLIIIMDFSKAFDTVPHDELLCKLESDGIAEPIHKWLRTFLTQQYMQVVVASESSSKVTVDSGVPKGMFWGLFLRHINDLPLMMGIGWIIILNRSSVHIKWTIIKYMYNRFISICINCTCICLSDSNPRDRYCTSMCT